MDLGGVRPARLVPGLRSKPIRPFVENFVVVLDFCNLRPLSYSGYSLQVSINRSGILEL
jgi:hypothetical protein